MLSERVKEEATTKKWACKAFIYDFIWNAFVWRRRNRRTRPTDRRRQQETEIEWERKREWGRER